jgi:ABC-2 type transport system ATP-binding protein
VVTCIDPEILLLDEGIGAVDSSFLDKARDRLHDLVRRSGILVFAPHSDDLLIAWCSNAIWLEEGRLRDQGTARDVVDRYSGRIPATGCCQENLRI